jgi:hypothetical protein
MDDLWKATLKLNECYRSAGSKSVAEGNCKEFKEDLQNIINSNDFDPQNMLKAFWINYHSNKINNILETKNYYAPTGYGHK